MLKGFRLGKHYRSVIESLMFNQTHEINKKMFTIKHKYNLCDVEITFQNVTESNWSNSEGVSRICMTYSYTHSSDSSE